MSDLALDYGVGGPERSDGSTTAMTNRLSNDSHNFVLLMSRHDYFLSRSLVRRVRLAIPSLMQSNIDTLIKKLGDSQLRMNDFSATSRICLLNQRPPCWGFPR